jgi:Na+/H+-dicarboxylate symporter
VTSARETPFRPWTRWLPKSVAGWCFLAIGLGIAAGFALGKHASMLQPVATGYVHAYALVVLPYLIFEVVVVLGGLRRRSLVLLLKNGGLALAGVMGLGVAAILFLPLMLPHLRSSPLFDPRVLESVAPPGFVETFLPSNLFQALAAGNVPGVLLFSVLIGFLLQGMADPQPVLNVLGPLRRLFGEAFSFVAKKIAPVGIFAITANAVGASSGGEWERVLGLAGMMATGFLAMGCVLLPGLVLGMTAFKPRDLWQVLRDPLVLAASTGNAIVAMPVLIESLRRLWDSLPGEKDEENFAVVEILAPVCLVYLSLGRLLIMTFLPFVAWFMDRPLDMADTAALLPTGIASVMGGAQIAILAELPRMGLPQQMLWLYLMNQQWIIRLAEPLSVMTAGMVAMLVFASMLRRWRIKPLWIGLAISLSAVLATGLGWGVRSGLALMLDSAPGSREVVLQRTSLLEGQAPIEKSSFPPAQGPSSLASIREAGVLRAGVVCNSAPWAYRNAAGRLVGFDIDLLSSLAEALGVRLEVAEGSFAELSSWLSEFRIDCAAGGIHGTGITPRPGLEVVVYEQATLAVVAPDDFSVRLQKILQGKSAAPLNFRYSSEFDFSRELERSLRRRIAQSGAGNAVRFQIEGVAGEFFESPPADSVLLTDAESGAALAVLNPDFIMIPAFGNDLTIQIELLLGTKDHSLVDFCSDWVAENRNLDLLERLRRWWIEFR